MLIRFLKLDTGTRKTLNQPEITFLEFEVDSKGQKQPEIILYQGTAWKFAYTQPENKDVLGGADDAIWHLYRECTFTDFSDVVPTKRVDPNVRD